MLTALSVAKEIGMIPPKQKTVLIQGYPQFEKADAYLEFVSAEEYSNEKTMTEVYLLKHGFIIALNTIFSEFSNLIHSESK